MHFWAKEAAGLAVIGAGKNGGYNSNYGGSAIYVDISDLMDTIDDMKKALSERAFHEMMRRTFNDAGRKVKTIVRREVPDDYEVTANWAGSMVGWPQAQGGGQIGVVVPIKGKRGSIGGRYHATGGSFTRKAYMRGGKQVRGSRINKQIRARIVKGQASAMPPTMPHQGGQPPFMVRGIGKSDVVFTRKYAHRPYPIVHVVGLGVPQMPINKSREDVQKDIRDVVEKRLEHYFVLLFNK